MKHNIINVVGDSIESFLDNTIAGLGFIVDTVTSSARKEISHPKLSDFQFRMTSNSSAGTVSISVSASGKYTTLATWTASVTTVNDVKTYRATFELIDSGETFYIAQIDPDTCDTIEHTQFLACTWRHSVSNEIVTQTVSNYLYNTLYTAGGKYSYSLSSSVVGVPNMTDKSSGERVPIDTTGTCWCRPAFMTYLYNTSLYHIKADDPDIVACPDNAKTAIQFEDGYQYRHLFTSTNLFFRMGKSKQGEA